MFPRVNLICHGYTAIPVILTLQKHGFFTLLEEEGVVTQEYLNNKLNARHDQIKAALDLLESLDWLRCNSSGEYTLSQKGVLYKKLMPQIFELYQFSMMDYFQSETATLQFWIEKSAKKWDMEEEAWADFFDGCFLVPLLVALNVQRHFTLNSNEKLLSALSDHCRREVTALFLQKAWITNDGEIKLTSAGKAILEHINNLRTVYTYNPLLLQTEEIMFGNDQSVAAINEMTSYLKSVNNKRFQNEEYLAKFDEATLEIFNKTPVDLQARYVMQIGCEDGELLKRLYNHVKQYSLRGKMLEKVPLTLVVIGESDDKLKIMREQLQNYPHIVLRANINHPEEIHQKIVEQGLSVEEILYVRTFSDDQHSHLSFEETGAGQEEKSGHTDVSVRVGTQTVEQTMGQWSEIIGQHGLLFLEQHTVPSSVKRKYFYESSDFSLDFCQNYLDKSLTTARFFMMNAARVGLFPSNECANRFPEDQSYTLATFNHFRKRQYVIRAAKLNDIDELLVLEEKCWARPLRVARHVLHERISRYAAGQYVMELDGHVVGVIYTQRIETTECLFSHNFRQVEENHKKNAPILQLLAANILPELQGQALGDQLLEFVLQLAAVTNNVDKVVAVTRCSDFDKQTVISMPNYIKARNAEGMVADPVLYFHEMHGAVIEKIVPNYRPGDAPNNNHGVLISYDIRSRKRLDQVFKNVDHPAVLSQEQRTARATLIEDIIRAAVQDRAGTILDLDLPLMQHGLKSVDLINLRGQLSQRLGEYIAQDFFFAYPTANAVIKKLCESASSEASTSLKNTIPHQRLSTVRKKVSVQSSSINPRSSLDNPDHAESKEAVAIIGMSCKFPGGINTPDSYWQLLKNSDDPISHVPSSRWSQAGLNSKAGWGGFLDRIDFFDAPFFNISSAEASAMDPQQRLHLEEIWKALENAGINPLKLAEENVGIFVGIFSEDYKQLSVKSHAENSIYFSTGTSSAAAAGRVAYFLGTQGPTMTVNTACSSSLVALHLASQSLRSGESNIALASGVNLLLTPELSENFANAGMLSQDGRCKSFDATANGYVRSEGCSVVVLKRLSDAQRDRDKIYAVIESTAVNQDGKSAVLTAPNPKAQEELFKKALKAAHRLPQEVDYIEAHGTGTPLGDPMEVNSIVKVYGGQRDEPLIIGSVKSNIGHTESAAGLAGLIKVVLSLQHELLPRQLHLNAINPAIQSDNHVVIPVEKTPWTRRKNRARVAGVSSFGFTGTNAHVILAEAPPEIKEAKNTSELVARQHQLLTIAAKSEEALAALAQDYLSHFRLHSDVSSTDSCYTSNVTRADFDYRIAVVIDRNESLPSALEARLKSGLPVKNISKKLAFLFTGQGSQSVGMGQQLYESEEVYRKTFDYCIKKFAAELKLSHLNLYELIFSGDEKQLNQTLYTQIALFSLEYALSQWWQSIGVIPDVVMGHSIGECVAAVVAGVMSLDDGIKLVAHRAQLMNAITTDGGMLAVQASIETIESFRNAYNSGVSSYDQVFTAADNSPNQVVLSGKAEALDKFIVLYLEGKFKFTRLAVSQAFHSLLLEPMLKEYEQIAQTIEYHPPRIIFIANITGKRIEHINAQYWVDQVVSPVRCREGFLSLAEQNVTHFLELGPRPLLITLGQQTLINEKNVWLSSINPRSAGRDLYNSVARLYEAGFRIDWESYHETFFEFYRKVDLPTYHFIGQRYWLTATAEVKNVASRTYIHPLLGERLPSRADQTNEYVIFQHRWPTPELDYLNDHRVLNHIIVPGAAYVEMCWVAMQTVAGETAKGGLSEISIEAPLCLSPDVQIDIQTLVERTGDDYTIRIYSRASTEQEWQQHASARWVKAQVNEDKYTSYDVTSFKSNAATKDINELYSQFDAIGLNYQPAFKIIKSISVHEDKLIAEIKMQDPLVGYLLPPSILDGCFQAMIALKNTNDLFLPVGISSIHVYSKLPERIFVIAERQKDGHESIMKSNAWITDENGEVLASIKGFSAKQTSPASFQQILSNQSKQSMAQWFYSSQWITQSLESSREDLAKQSQSLAWILMGKQQESLINIREKLLQQGVDIEKIFLIIITDNSEEKEYGVSSKLKDIIFNHKTDLGGIIWIDDNNLSHEFIDEASLLEQAQGPRYGLLLSLVKTLQSERIKPKYFAMITQGAQSVHEDCTNPLAASVWGFATTMHQEMSDFPLVVLDIDPAFSFAEQSQQVMNVIIHQTEHWIALRNEIIYVRRLKSYHDFPMPLTLPDSRHFVVSKSASGKVNELQYAPAQSVVLPANGVEIDVKAIGLNFRDVLNARNLYPGDPGPLGCDCAGIITAIGSEVKNVEVGDRVMSMAMGCLGTQVYTTSALVAPIPEAMNFADAATIPTVFLTVYESLVNQGQLKKGDRVLIHTATGGIGLAAIQVCQLLGAEIYATAGSEDKRQYLQSLGIKHVYSSRTLDFKAEILQKSEGEALIDVVLNTLTGAGFIEASLSVCRSNARFIELSKINTWSPEQMASVRSDIGYAIVALDTISATTPAKITELWEALAPLFLQNQLKPLPMIAFSLFKVREAFSYMQHAKHMGKVVIEVPSLEKIAQQKLTPDITTNLELNGSYLITGGLGSLGLATAQWLLEQDAKSLILISRRTASTEVLSHLKMLREKFSAEIHVWPADVSDKAAVELIIKQIAMQSLPPLRGVFHAAGVLSDKMLQSQDWASFDVVYRGKVLSAWYLHEATQNIPLDYFVMYSSMTAVLGNLGQSNYGAANACLDSLAHYRRQKNKAAQTINWGPWDVGMAENLKSQFNANGLLSIPVEQGMKALQKIVAYPALCQIMVLAVDWKRYLPTVPEDAFYELLEQRRSPSLAFTKTTFVQSLQALPQEGRLRFIQNEIIAILKTVHQSSEKIISDITTGFTEMGMDSLTISEARNKINQLFGTEYTLPPTSLYDYPSVEKLSIFIENHFLQKSKKTSVDKKSVPEMKMMPKNTSDSLATRCLKEKALPIEDIPLFSIVRANKLQLLKSRVESKKMSLLLTDKNGKTVLHQAVLLGDAVRVNSLLQMGAPLNTATKLGITPLMLAIADNLTDIVKIFLTKLPAITSEVASLAKTPAMSALLLSPKARQEQAQDARESKSSPLKPGLFNRSEVLVMPGSDNTVKKPAAGALTHR